MPKQPETQRTLEQTEKQQKITNGLRTLFGLECNCANQRCQTIKITSTEQPRKQLTPTTSKTKPPNKKPTNAGANIKNGGKRQTIDSKYDTITKKQSGGKTQQQHGTATKNRLD